MLDELTTAENDRRGDDFAPYWMRLLITCSDSANDYSVM